MKKVLMLQPLVDDKKMIGILRIVVGIFMVYHGFEIFNEDTMAVYTGWFAEKKFPAPLFWGYLGKTTEFICGIFLLIGLFTRIVCIPLMIAMLFIVIVLGHGKIFYEDQHPFLFFLFFLLFFISGPGKWSLDKLLFDKQNNY